MGSRFEYPKFQAFDHNGDPLSGGWLYGYYPGTSTPKALYHDSALTTAWSYPIALDSRGEQSIYGNGGYKLVLTYPGEITGVYPDEVYTPGASIWTVDNVYGSSGSGFSSGASLSDWGCILSDAVTDIGSDDVSLCVDCDCSVGSDLVVPVNINLRFINGCIITVASGKTLTIGNMTDPGPFELFAGTGTVVFADNSTDIVRPEWWGAVADGDAGTDSGPALLAAITAAPDGAKVQLLQGDGYYNAGTTLALGNTKFVHIRGPATIYYGGAGKLFDIRAGTSFQLTKHKLQDLFLFPSAGNERVAAGQTAIYLEASTWCQFLNVKIDGFYKGIWLHNTTGSVGSFTAFNEFRHVISRKCMYCLYMDTDGTWSMGSNVWDQVDLSPYIAGTGWYLGAGASVYRNLCNITIFVKEINAKAGEFYGIMTSTNGTIHIEGNHSAGTTGFYFGEDSVIRSDILSHVFGLDGYYYAKHASAVSPVGWKMVSRYGNASVIFSGANSYIDAVTDGGYILYDNAFEMSSTNPVTVTWVAHGLLTGDTVVFENITQTDWDDLNDQDFNITYVSANSFTIEYDASLYAAYIPSVSGVIRGGINHQWRTVSNAGANVNYFRDGVTYTDPSTTYRASLSAMFKTFQRISVDSTTPDVAGCNTLRIANTVPTEITRFTGGVDGQFLFVYVSDDNTTFMGNVGAEGKLAIDGYADYIASEYDLLLFWYNPTSNMWSGGVINGARSSGRFDQLPTRANIGDTYFCTNCTTGSESLVWNGTGWQAPDGTVVSAITWQSTQEQLLSTTTIALNADADTTIYTVPTGYRCVPTKAVLVVGGDAGTTQISIGANGTETDFIGNHTLSALDLAYDSAILTPIPSATPAVIKSYAAGVVIQARVSAQAGVASNTLYLFGFLYAP